jgi:phage baseplate assembly protein W
MITEQLHGSGRYLSFPFRMTSKGGLQSARMDHIREQIAQVLLTGPGERVFLKNFGLGVNKLLFMPMTNELWRQIESSLAIGIA